MQETEEIWAGWMRAALAGDGQAYARFLRAVTPVLRGIVRARARWMSGDDQEDIVQEVLLAIHRKRDTWSPDRPIRPWLFAVTRHKVIDAFRKRGGEATQPLGDQAEQVVDPHAEAHLQAQEASEELDALIGTLDPEAAELVRALKLREESPESVARAMSISEGALRVRLHRAMKRLEQIGRSGLP
ncbi:sigma-70 family RNA polymerase sigma factor [Thioclava sp. A2]|uniref:sigma-70 family RNA polymerase sigma factor n=1 Tax=Thioclava sp. FCG-A2 TaxID=3080562 RepID=UPI00295439F5|nr:sigma-70 family RNA polymerase sigma factor [Thioclava sp. A2]MDV7271069.1 sigma-70 family RNA polymerase sigma factor [Thioclava sp. A2]